MNTRIFSAFLFCALALAGCKKNNEPLPTVETIVTPFVASTRVSMGLHITSDVAQSSIDGGLYIGLEPNPDQTASTPLHFAADTGLFYVVVNNFSPNTKYYVKAFAFNKSGKALGNELNFTTPATIQDNDNHVVDVVTIGTQTWMDENLRTIKFRNGEYVPTTTPGTKDISSEDTPVYYWYTNNMNDSSIVYGNLYTWYAVTDSRNICPTGWHVPTDAEWATLETALGSNLIAASLMKDIGNDHWIYPYNKDANNMSCFTALPSGYRSASGSFNLIQNEAHFWSATESEPGKAWERLLTASSYSTTRQGALKNSGLSVRCIKD